jgi:hypothetical protein
VLCEGKENVDHLLFLCPMAEFLWAFVSETLGWEGYPRSTENLVQFWLPKGFRTNVLTCLTCFCGMASALWIMRNKMCMQKVFPHIVLDVIYLGISFLQRWHPSRHRYGYGYRIRYVSDMRTHYFLKNTNMGIQIQYF